MRWCCIYICCNKGISLCMNHSLSRLWVLLITQTHLFPSDSIFINKYTCLVYTSLECLEDFFLTCAVLFSLSPLFSHHSCRIINMSQSNIFVTLHNSVGQLNHYSQIIIYQQADQTCIEETLLDKMMTTVTSSLTQAILHKDNIVFLSHRIAQQNV